MKNVTAHDIENLKIRPSLVNLTELPPVPISYGGDSEETVTKEEETMCNENNTYTTEMQKTDYLVGRMYTIKNIKDLELERKFGVADDERPRTPADFVDRILKGKYTISEDNKNRNVYSPEDYIKWRDPNLKRDDIGYKAAFKKLEAAATVAMDVIKVVSDETARLKALQDFETTTIN